MFLVVQACRYGENKKHLSINLVVPKLKQIVSQIHNGRAEMRVLGINVLLSSSQFDQILSLYFWDHLDFFLLEQDLSFLGSCAQLDLKLLRLVLLMNLNLLS